MNFIWHIIEWLFPSRHKYFLPKKLLTEQMRVMFEREKK